MSWPLFFYTKNSSTFYTSSTCKVTGNLTLVLNSVAGGTAAVLSVVCLPFVSPALRRICLPYVPATATQIKNVMCALAGRSGRLVDLGSGDGRIVSYIRINN
jgi:hypothetical protein